MEKTTVKGKEKRQKHARGGRGGRKIGFWMLGVGLVALIAGVAVLIMNLTTGPAKRDAEYLVEQWAFMREGEPGVYWHFTEVGEGYLTTDGYDSVYDFSWAIKDGRLLMETDWLYQLNDEFNYTIDQEAGTMTLVRADSNVEIVYLAVTEAEIEENLGGEAEGELEGVECSEAEGCSCSQEE